MVALSYSSRTEIVLLVSIIAVIGYSYLVGFFLDFFSSSGNVSIRVLERSSIK